jgi:hypothetical protein
MFEVLVQKVPILCGKFIGSCMTRTLPVLSPRMRLQCYHLNNTASSLVREYKIQLNGEDFHCGDYIRKKSYEKRRRKFRIRFSSVSVPAKSSMSES